MWVSKFRSLFPPEFAFEINRNSCIEFFFFFQLPDFCSFLYSMGHPTSKVMDFPAEGSGGSMLCILGLTFSQVTGDCVCLCVHVCAVTKEDVYSESKV